MKMDLSPQEIAQGRFNQNKTQETPNSFTTGNGASVVAAGSRLDRTSNPMAGKVGERALSMLNDPVEIQRTQNWMNAFKLSPAAMDNGWVLPPPPPEAPAKEQPAA